MTEDFWGERDEQSCGRCVGTGAVSGPNDSDVACDKCNGTGWVPDDSITDEWLLAVGFRIWGLGPASDRHHVYERRGCDWTLRVWKPSQSRSWHCELNGTHIRSFTQKQRLLLLMEDIGL